MIQTKKMHTNLGIMGFYAVLFKFYIDRMDIRNDVLFIFTHLSTVKISLFKYIREFNHFIV